MEPHIVAPDGTDKGGGLVATVDHGSGEVLLAVPMELLLSKERVEQCAKEDKNLRELIEAVPSLFQVGEMNSIGLNWLNVGFMPIVANR